MRTFKIKPIALVAKAKTPKATLAQNVLSINLWIIAKTGMGPLATDTWSSRQTFVLMKADTVKEYTRKYQKWKFQMWTGLCCLYVRRALTAEHVMRKISLRKKKKNQPAWIHNLQCAAIKRDLCEKPVCLCKLHCIYILIMRSGNIRLQRKITEIKRSREVRESCFRRPDWRAAAPSRSLDTCGKQHTFRTLMRENDS